MTDKTHKGKGISVWRLTMMALGTVIGGSFFLGSSVAIRAAGPSVVVTYAVGGILVYFILFALSEMTVADPDPGSFRTYAAQAFGPGTGFVVGWVYWTGIALSLSSEAAAASILLRRWIPNVPAVWLSGGIIIAVTLLNLLGADKLSRLESGLTAIKLLAIVSFILAAAALITGVFTGNPGAGWGILLSEPFAPGGIKGIAGSLLIVIFAFAGFEIIGLAASDAEDPRKTVPRAIKYTVLGLVGLYILSVVTILLLVPTSEITQDVSPMVAALNRNGIGWAGLALNIVLITAILSTMLAAMFGLGRMIRSLADRHHAPKWLMDKNDVPRRGILFSGFSMLAASGFGLLFPSAYLFLMGSGGFALLFTYAVIVATQIRFRKKYGCPPEGKCQMPGYPYTSWTVLFVTVVAIAGMPLIPGQTPGLIAGILLVTLFTGIYIVMKAFKRFADKTGYRPPIDAKNQPGFSADFSEELTSGIGNADRNEPNDTPENH